MLCAEKCFTGKVVKRHFGKKQNVLIKNLELTSLSDKCFGACISGKLAGSSSKG